MNDTKRLSDTSSETAAPDKDNANSKYILHSVETAMKVLDQFMNHEKLSATDVANLLHMNRSTAFRFLVTLEQSGYISKTDNAQYRLSAKVSALGQLAHSRMELITLIHPYLTNLTKESGETSHLVSLEDDISVTFIDKVVGTGLLKMDIPVSYTTNAHYTASGKAILAFSSDKRIQEYIKNASFELFTESSIKDAKELLLALDQIREEGFARDHEESEIGLSCISVPIIVSGQPLAAISISGPTTRIIKKEEQLLKLLKNAKNRIEISLGNK